MTAAGFDAFRRLVWVLPAGWPTIPLLYVPGVKWLGRQVYAAISTRPRRSDQR
jgi:hypothetical protein